MEIKIHSHKLTDADRWFIEKGRLDVLSRSPFAVGDTIVICDHKHVMLADFYEGMCHECHSRVTLPFNRSNIEFSPLPKPVREFLWWFFPAKTLQKLLPVANKALKWTLGVIIIGIFLLALTGVIHNEQFVSHLQMLAFQKTKSIFTSIGGFIVSNSVNSLFLERNSEILVLSVTLLVNMTTVPIKETSDLIMARHEVLFANMLAVLVILANGLKDIGIVLSEQFQETYFKTKELFGLFDRCTRTLIDVIKKAIL